MSKKIKKFLILPLLLILIFSYPLKLSFGAGPGSCTVSPSEVISGTTNDFVFTYTATQRMPGGTVKINIKEPFTAPQKDNPTGHGYVEIGGTSPNCIIGRTLNNMDDSILWYSSDWSHISLSSDTTAANKKEGYASLKLTISSSAVANDKVYTNINITHEEYWISFWIKPSVNVTQGQLKFVYSYNVGLPSPFDGSIDIPALPVNTWSYIKLNISSTSDIKSIGFIYAVDFMTTGGTIWIDEILIESKDKELSIIERDLFIRILDMQNGDYFKIDYKNVTAPTVSTDTPYTFKTETRADPSLTLSEISPSPTIKVLKPPSATKLIYTSSKNQVNITVQKQEIGQDLLKFKGWMLQITQ